jgi:hemoglobin-like flavoprotein
MSPETAELVRASWSAILPRRKEVCGAFYRRLFESYPEVRPLFKGDMERQTNLFVTMINTVVSALENPQPVRPLIQTLGARHADYGVSLEDYRKFEEVLLDTLGQALGDDFTEETRAAWSRVYEGLAATMQASIGERQRR